MTVSALKRLTNDKSILILNMLVYNHLNVVQCKEYKEALSVQVGATVPGS